ncbi:dienelactone hydrolase family protein [Pleurocapsa sp. PCC 7319]|uniref:dienelactone hydrolase family protein n=1 Tax=Pleurocapsa sp. PCC 7319 TaxID=118161 RepID=UPI00034AE40F|nr:dienelactone hydrolase family protein [Pleurocapsa sp. PCC 7319]
MNIINRQKLVIGFVFLASLLFSLGLSLIQPETGTLLAAHRYDYPSPTAIALIEPKVPVTTESVEYVTIDGQAINGYYAYPQDATEPLPGILAIHEWWGLNDNIKSMTQRLAGEGYQVLAVDLYNGQIAETPEQASQLVQEVANNPFGAEANITKAYDYLAEEKQAPKVATIGWCFGGSWSLETALLFPQELDAAVIYYGGQVGEATTEELSTLEMPILGIFGAEDSSIPVETVENLESTLNELGKEAEIEIYENAGHAFANPSGQNYVPEAAEQAWAKTTEFLDEHLAS